MLERPKQNQLENLQYPKELSPILNYLLKNIEQIEYEIGLIIEIEDKLTDEEKLATNEYDRKRLEKSEEYLQNFIDGNYMSILNILESECGELEDEINYYKLEPQKLEKNKNLEREETQEKIDTLMDILRDVRRYKKILEGYLVK